MSAKERLTEMKPQPARTLEQARRLQVENEERLQEQAKPKRGGSRVDSTPNA